MLCAILAAGCGEVLDDPDASTSGAIDADNVSIADATGGAPDAASSGDPDASTERGCFSGECGDTQFCDFPDHRCGAGVEGVCRERTDCSGATGNPVCTCAGTIYSDECTAYVTGSDVADSGSCETPGAFFPCGYTYCLAGFDYCQLTKPGAPDAFDEYKCVGLPDGCDVCGCMTTEPCGENCTGDVGKLTLICAP